MTPKRRASNWCSKYIRLRDCLAFCKKKGIDISEFSNYRDLPVACCTCGNIKTFRQSDAGHFFSRGMGGRSGVYFDERNINTQCKSCNGFKGGNIESYRDFMLEKYGQKIIDELRFLHHAGKRYQNGEVIAIGLMYKQMFEELQ